MVSDGIVNGLPMAVEQITLSAVAVAKRSSNEDVDLEERGSGEFGALVRTYLIAAQVRDRFAFTRSARARRREQFEQAAKTVVKNIATEGARVVVDRTSRADARTRFYVGAMVLVRAVSIDQQKVLERSRRRLRWSAALAIVGLLGFCGTLIGNGILRQPW